MVSNVYGLQGWARLCPFCGIVTEGALEECLMNEILATQAGCPYCGGKEHLPKLNFPLVAFAAMRIVLERVYWIAAKWDVPIGWRACGCFFRLAFEKGDRPFRLNGRRYKRLYGVYNRMRKEIEGRRARA